MAHDVRWSSLFLVVVAHLSDILLAYPSGAPMSACSNMIPNHGVSQSSSASPYSIHLADGVTTYSPDTPITIEVRGGGYKGLLLQVRMADGTVWPVGTFTSPPDSTRARQCSNGDDTMTHTNNDVKNGLVYTWQPPRESQGPLQVIATVVQEKTTWWKDIKSDTLSPSGYEDPSSNSVTSEENENSNSQNNEENVNENNSSDSSTEENDPVESGVNNNEDVEEVDDTNNNDSGSNTDNSVSENDNNGDNDSDTNDDNNDVTSLPEDEHNNAENENDEELELGDDTHNNDNGDTGNDSNSDSNNNGDNDDDTVSNDTVNNDTTSSEEETNDTSNDADGSQLDAEDSRTDAQETDADDAEQDSQNAKDNTSDNGAASSHITCILHICFVAFYLFLL